ncbi:hypothetical protein [Chryseobacterium arthrosphaerae]|uniref:hypothetical protein n=1 Tax=Chryseobacterium arthrosphaerae TaxID=651561 RepID=UPI00241CDC17|nr:hypothetical protein [Chryseobacterium arthrosphaerae]
MYPISNRINILQKAAAAKSTFINDEALPSAVTTFTCCDCSHENPIEIQPYSSGFPVIQLYHEDKVLSGNELLQNGMASETSDRMLHFGVFTVDDLPTLYFGTDCSSCRSKYICVFSYGEKQPGLMKLNISGIWKYEDL